MPVYVYFMIAIFVIISIISIAYNIKKRKSDQKAVDEFVKQHPDAAKLYFLSKAAVTSETITLVSIDGDLPLTAYEGTKMVAYMVPGTHTLEVDYTYTRPGVMYKTVSKSTGVVQKAITVEANQSYMLGFDRKAEQFTLDVYTA